MIEPKLLTTEELLELYRTYEGTGQLFAHVAALHRTLKLQDEIMDALLHGKEKSNG